MRCAVVNSSDIVTNIIVADPATDPAPENCILVSLPDDSPVSSGWVYTPATGQFTDPNPPAPPVEGLTP